MAGIKISDMTPDASISGVELIPVSDTGVSKSMTVTTLKQFVIDSIEALAVGTTTTTADSLFYLQGGVMKSVDIDIIVQYAIDTIWAGTAATVPADADKIPLMQTATGKTLTLTLLAEYVRSKIEAAILDASSLGTAGALVDADYFHVTQSAVGKKVAFSTIIAAIYAGLTAWITALDAVTSPSSADVFLLVRSGVSKKITWANLLAVVGNTFAPATTTENYVPQWASAQKTLKDGLSVVTTLRATATAADTALATEKATRTAIDAASYDTIWTGAAAATVPADADKVPLLQTATGKTLTLPLLAEYVRSKTEAAILDASNLTTADALVDADYLHVTQTAVGKKVTFSTVMAAIYAGLAAWITALTGITSPSSSDVFMFLRSGVPKKITWAEILAVVGNTFAPATTTENYVPQWSSAQKTLKDGLLLRTAVRAAASADDLSLPTELAVRTALDDLAYDAVTTFTGGSAEGSAAMRIGATATEGLTTMVVDTVVTLGAVAGVAVFTVPDNALLRAVQGNIQVAAVAGGTSVAVGIGVTANVDVYGLTANLNKNTKSDTAMAPTLTTSTVAIEAYPVTAAGAIGNTAFSAGTLRVRIVYDVLASLDNV
jgi:hypothetical protein